jgi:hypothetical protein
MTDDDRSWALLFRETLADDPEWTAYMRNVSPRTPLRKAVEEYVRLLSRRIALTEQESRAAAALLTAIEESEFATADEFFDAVERGEVSLKGRRTRKRKPREDRVPGWDPEPRPAS